MSRFEAELLSVKKIQLTNLIEWFVESDRKQHFTKDRKNLGMNTGGTNVIQPEFVM
jgi:hypothetical protein